MLRIVGCCGFDHYKTSAQLPTFPFSPADIRKLNRQGVITSTASPCLLSRLSSKSRRKEKATARVDPLRRCHHYRHAYRRGQGEKPPAGLQLLFIERCRRRLSLLRLLLSAAHSSIRAVTTLPCLARKTVSTTLPRPEGKRLAQLLHTPRKLRVEEGHS